MIVTSPLLTAALFAALTVEATPLKGDPVQGELSSVSQSKVVVATADGPQTFPLAALRSLQVVDAVESAPDEPVIIVTLRDQSRLLATKFSTTDGQASVTAAEAGCSGPVSDLHWVQLKSLEKEPDVLKDWEGLLKREFAGDCLAFPREVDGEISLEHLEGAIADITDTVVEFKYQGDSLKPKREKVLGLIYLVANRAMPDTVGIVKLTDGSSLAAAELEWKDESLSVTTSAGWKLDVPSDKLLSLELGASNITYLSDLRPTDVKCEPYFGVVLDTERQTYLPRMDQDHHGNPLKLVGQESAPKGLAIRSHSTLTYRFEKPYKRLRAMVGIAEHVRDSDVTPHLVLVISSDRKKLLEREISGDQDPFELDLDLTGVQRLIIEVQYGKSQDIADFLHLCNARVTK